MGEILLATDTLQYVAFTALPLSTLEGKAYLFLAVDAKTGYVFNLGLTRAYTPETILQKVYELTEHPEFTGLLEKTNKGFTLVMEDNEALFDAINNIVKYMQGNVILNKTYNNHLSNPVLASILQNMKKGRK